ncbi:MAG: hypothetical protein ACREIC_04935, partial [Limisphaerales bacterium]
MKSLWKKLVIVIVAGIAIAALIYGYVQMSKERAKEAQADQPIVTESKVESSTNGEAVVKLDTETQKLIGLETTTLASVTQAPDIKAYGRVLDASSLIGLASDIASARAALDASGKEYQRTKVLFAQGQNASPRELEAAEAAMNHDQIGLNT